MDKCFHCKISIKNLINNQNIFRKSPNNSPSNKKEIHSNNNPGSKMVIHDPSFNIKFKNNLSNKIYKRKELNAEKSSPRKCEFMNKKYNYIVENQTKWERRKQNKYIGNTVRNSLAQYEDVELENSPENLKVNSNIQNSIIPIIPNFTREIICKISSKNNVSNTHLRENNHANSPTTIRT